MKFGIQYQLNVVRPLDSEDWDPGDEHKRFKEALEQIEFADKLGFDYVFETEHHFLEEYSALVGAGGVPGRRVAAHEEHAPRPRHRPDAAAAEPPRPRRRAHRHAGPRVGRPRRVRHRRGRDRRRRSAASARSARRRRRRGRRRRASAVRMMTETPYPGFEGEHFSMPERNIVPKPLQKPHPPLWVAASRRETVMVGARLGMGALGFGFETPEEAAGARVALLRADPQLPLPDRQGDQPGAGGGRQHDDGEDERRGDEPRSARGAILRLRPRLHQRRGPLRAGPPQPGVRRALRPRRQEQRGHGDGAGRRDAAHAVPRRPARATSSAARSSCGRTCASTRTRTST